MMAICPECGKRHVVTWPDLNPFRRGDDYYCSPKCYEISVSRDMTKIKQVALIRRQRKNMKLKKDGTPAKKPGRKPQKQIEIPAGEFKPAVDLSAPKKAEVPEKVPVVKVDGALKIETPEANKVEVVETPEQAVIKNKVVDIMEELKIRNPLQYEEFTVREVEGLFGRYRRSDIGQETYIDFEPPECVDVISNTLTQWSSFMKELKRAAQVLGVEM